MTQPDHAEALRVARSYMDQSGRVQLSASQIGAIVRALLAATELLRAAEADDEGKE